MSSPRQSSSRGAQLTLVTLANKAAPALSQKLPYLSPVKPLPAANSVGASGEADQWKDF